MRPTAIAAAALGLMLAAPATAQTHQPTSVATRHNPLFGSDWARPPSQTGGYFYNDPRLRNSNQPLRPNAVICPRGRVCY